MKFISHIKVALIFSPVLLVAESTAAFPAHATSQQIKAYAQQIADHFCNIRTMTGDFVQFGPRGETAEGAFYMERPGKIRFIYKNSPIRVISDGQSIAINNRKLNTWSLYQLQQTPMKLLLSDHIDVSEHNLLEFRQESSAITFVIVDNSIGKLKIRMIFDPKTFKLRQWTIIDQQNLETTIQLINTRTGVAFANGMFDIDYQRIGMKRKNR
ncbi:MAG: Outer membrane lipoprotein-sorting protein [Candidatus Tokpelaia sp. JSC189]|nr:MAG: Outer membrane lipoprotein-sorting protein [Candidatus Tokpelaia sp. JSC189]